MDRNSPRKRCGIFYLILLLNCIAFVSTQIIREPNWVLNTAWTGLSQPISVRFAGTRAFLITKGGLIFTAADSNSPLVLSYDLSTKVYNNFDKGLVGLAIPPNFATNRRLYIFFTADKPPGGTEPFYNDACNSQYCITTGTIGYVTLNDMFMGLGFTTLWTDKMCTHSTTHDCGSLNFDATGALYATLGEGSLFDPVIDVGDVPGTCGFISPPDSSIDMTYGGGSFRSQANTSPHGKVLRFSATQVATDNFATFTVIGKGLRNPYRSFYDRDTNDLWVADVGAGTWEELNRLPNANTQPTAAGIVNFEWPCHEGTLERTEFTSRGTTCYAPRFVNLSPPFALYSHNGVIGTPDVNPAGGQSAITSVVVYKNPTADSPAAIRNAIFIACYVRGAIFYVSPGGGPLNTVLRGMPNIVDITEGPDQFLYVTTITGTIYRFFYSTTPLPPVVSVTATKQPLNNYLTVAFDTTGTYDPLGAPLTYSWTFGDGTGTSTAANPTYTYATRAVRTVTLVVSNNAQSTTTTFQVSPGYFFSPITITPSIANNTWEVGTTVGYSGSATDQSGNVMPATAFSWQLLLNHCYLTNCDKDLACHQHTLETISGAASGSLRAPEHEYPAFLTLRMTVTHPTVAAFSQTIEYALYPKVYSYTVSSTPPGLDVNFGFLYCRAPCTYHVVANSSLTLTTRSPQMSLDGTLYGFNTYSTGITTLNFNDIVTSSKTVSAQFSPLTYSVDATAAPTAISLTCTFDSCSVAFTAPAVTGTIRGYVIRYKQIQPGSTPASIPYSFYLVADTNGVIRNLLNGIETDVGVAVLVDRSGALTRGSFSADVIGRTSLAPFKGASICDHTCKNRQIVLDDWSDDDNTKNTGFQISGSGGGAVLGKNAAAQGTLTLPAVGFAAGFYYTKFSEKSCFDVSLYTHLTMQVNLPAGMDYTIKFDYLDSTCTDVVGSSALVPIRQFVPASNVLTTVEIPLTMFGVFPFDRVTALVSQGFTASGTIIIDNIQVVSRCTGTVCPSLVVDRFNWDNRYVYASGINALGFPTGSTGMASDGITYSGLSLVPSVPTASWNSRLASPGSCRDISSFTYLTFDYSVSMNTTSPVNFNVAIENAASCGGSPTTLSSFTVVPANYPTGKVSIPLTNFPLAALQRAQAIVFIGLNIGWSHQFSNLLLTTQDCCTPTGSVLVDDYEVAARFTGRTNALNGWFGSGTGITIGRVTTPSNQLSLQATSATGNWFATNLASTTCYDGRATPYFLFQVTPPVSPATFTVEIQLRNAACTDPDFTLSKFWTVTTSGTNPQIISLNLLDAGKFAVADLSRLQSIVFSGLPITATPFLFDNIGLSSCPCATVFVDDYESAANFAAAQNLRGGWLGVGADMTMARVTSPSNKLSLRRTGAGTGNWFATNFSPAGCYDGRATPFLSFEVTAPVAPTTLNVQVQLRNAACTATDFTLSQTWPISLDSTTPRTITINLLERFAVASLARLQAVSFVAFPTTAGPFLFDNIQLQSGSTCSATVPSTPPVTPPPCTTVLVDDFVPDAQYNVNHLNDRGGWTNDDGTLGLNSVANSVLSLTPNGAPDYWYSNVLVNNACLDASATPILEIVAAASAAASFQVEVQIRSVCTSAGTITRYSFPLSVTTSFTVYRIDLTTQIPVASLSRVGAISLIGPWSGPIGTTSYFIDRIMFISSTTSCAVPLTSTRLKRREMENVEVAGTHEEL